MSLYDAAEYLQTHGRGKDSMLVHMSPREVSGLQAIAEQHGGSLTVNPNTGLPEAGFLEDILPVIAGVALNAFVPGLGAAASGLLVGGATAAITGDLEKGLMAGLGAFGGSGIAGNLAKAGAQTAAKAGVNALDDVAVNAARGGADISTQLAQSATQPALQNAAAAGLQNVASGGAQATPGFLPGSVQNAMAAGQNRLGQMGQGISNIANTPGAGMQFIKDSAFPVGAATLPVLAGMNHPGRPNLEDQEPTNPFLKRRLSPGFQGFVPPQPNYYQPSGLGYASGGPIRKMSDMPEPRLAPPAMRYGEGIARNYDTDRLRADEAALKMVSNANKRARIKDAPRRKTRPLAMASGGLASIGGYSDGGRLLRGPGDGMSDSIPAVIDEEHPARLTDGEFVVPSDVVSHLGNGSTEAGADRLYEMLDRVRHARTGRKKQAPEINAEKYLVS